MRQALDDALKDTSPATQNPLPSAHYPDEVIRPCGRKPALWRPC